MKIIYNSLIPLRGFCTLNICGVVFARREWGPLPLATITHERIHTAQMRELAYVGFYLCYVAEWCLRLCMHGNAYRSLSFEREAYRHQHDPHYLQARKRFAQWRG